MFTRSCAVAAVACVSLTVAASAGRAAEAASTCRDASDPDEGAIVEIRLSSGERLKGVYGGCKGVAVLINHALLGLLVVPRSDVAAMAEGELPAPPAVAAVDAEKEAAAVDATIVDPADSAVSAGDEPAEEVVAEDSIDLEPESEDVPEEPASPWELDVEVGLNGTQGNSNDFDGRAGIDTKRTSERTEFTAGLHYNLDMNGRSTDEQTGDALLRNDWLFPGSPWRYFVSTNWDYTDQEEWEFRGRLETGPAYAFIDNDRTQLIGRTGFGVLREFGGDDDDFHPTWSIGHNTSHKLTDRWTLSWDANYIQKIDDGEFLVVNEANADYKLSNSRDISLRFGAKDTYNSDPDGDDDENDLSYWLSLLLGF